MWTKFKLAVILSVVFLYLFFYIYIYKYNYSQSGAQLSFNFFVLDSLSDPVSQPLFPSLCFFLYHLGEKLTLLFPIRKPWWTTLCRWSPTLLTLVTLWCWWRDGSSKGRTAMPLRLRELRRNVSWSATSFLQRMWVLVSAALFRCLAISAAFWFVIPLIRGLVASAATVHYTTWSVWTLAKKPTNELTIEGLVTTSFTLLRITSRVEWTVWVGKLFQLGLVSPPPKQPQSSAECKTGLAVVPVFHFWKDWIGHTVSF